MLIQVALTVLVLTVIPVLVLRWIDPPVSTFMMGDRWEAALRDEPGYRFAYHWVDREDISPHLQIAVIAAEDQRFVDHHGFDLVEIGNAVSARMQGRSSRGASTLSQQTAKNLFLWSGQSWIRKGLEAWLTVWIEWLWPKQRILEVYLNIAEFGSGAFGVEAASQRYFSTSARNVGPAQSALLAAVLPNPSIYRVDQPGPRVRQRQQWIQRQVRAIGGVAHLQELAPP